ncbi:MAG: hypothetical protein AB2A00_40745 [Myxococcota bacterium]
MARAAAWLAGLLALGVATGARADGRAFTDSRDRFRLDLPPGWELAPQPGDTEGMVFRRKSGAVPAIVAVRVAALGKEDNHVSVMDARGRSFERELGYERLGELEARVGELRALRRTHTVTLNGDDQIKRFSVDHVLLSFGHAHYIHFETAEGHYPEFQRDLESILRSYRPLVGRKLYEPVVGRWRMVGGAAGAELVLSPDQQFTMGQRAGLYRVDGVRLVLQDALGKETYKYLASDEVLTLHNDNLTEPMSFRRVEQSAATAEPGDSEEAQAKARRALKVTQQLLVGRWVVVEGGDAHEMVLSEGGAMRFGPMSGRFRLKGNLLTVESSTGVSITYVVTYDGKRIRLTGGDLDRPLVLERRP